MPGLLHTQHTDTHIAADTSADTVVHGHRYTLWEREEAGDRVTHFWRQPSALYPADPLTEPLPALIDTCLPADIRGDTFRHLKQARMAQTLQELTARSQACLYDVTGMPL